MSNKKELKEIQELINQCTDQMVNLGCEMDNIQSELDLDLNVGHRDNEWRIRATHALNVRKSMWSKLKQKKYRLISQHRELKREINVEVEKARLAKAHKKKTENIIYANARNEFEKKSLIAWIKKEIPDRADEAFAVLTSAGDKFDANNEKHSEAQT
jgi:hypothetical protein